MNLHEFLAAADAAGYLITVDREVDPYLEAARLAAEVDGRPILFRQVKGSPFPVVAGVCSDRRYFGMALGVPADQVMFRLAEALAAALTPSPSPSPGREVPNSLKSGTGQPVSPQNWEAGGAPCQEIIEPEVNLEALPFLTHYAGDAGAYASAAVAFIDDPETGPNASYHRLLRLDRTRVAARLVERRGTETAWRSIWAGWSARRHLHRAAAARAAGRVHGAAARRGRNEHRPGAGADPDGPLRQRHPRPRRG